MLPDYEDEESRATIEDIQLEEKKEEPPQYEVTWKHKLRELTCCFWIGLLGNTLLFMIWSLDVYGTFLNPKDWSFSMTVHFLNGILLDFTFVLAALGCLPLLHNWWTCGSFYFITRNYFACMGIVVANILTILLWIIISTSSYSPALFDLRFNGGEHIIIPEPRFQDGQPFNMLNFLSLKNTQYDVVSKTYDVRNYSENPRYPKGDFAKLCCGAVPVPPSEWEERLRLDVVKAPAFVNQSGLPVIFHVHGGGFTSGHRSDLWLLTPLVSQGYAIVSVSYRFLQYGYPANDMVVDIIEGLEWVVSQGTTYGLDPFRILIIGISAGGHLALLSSVIWNEKHPGRVRVVINVAGSSAIQQLRKRELRKEIFLFDFLKELYTKLANVTGSDDPEIEAKFEWLSVSSHLNNTNFTIVTIHGMGDWLSPYLSSVLFHQELQHLEIPNYLLSMPTTCHGGLILSQYITHILERCAAKFLF